MAVRIVAAVAEEVVVHIAGWVAHSLAVVVEVRIAGEEVVVVGHRTAVADQLEVGLEAELAAGQLFHQEAQESP